MFLQGLSDYQTPILRDQDVNYYGFLESKEYIDFYKSLENKQLSSDMYESPYFGMQSSGAYKELDRIYEDYKSYSEFSIDILEPDQSVPNVKRVTSTTSTISPLLILAAAAAFFIGG